MPWGPPELHEGVLGLGDEDAREAVLVGDLKLVEALDVERDRPLRAVDLEGVVVDPAARQTRRLEGADCAALELDRRHEVVVDRTARNNRAHKRRDGGDLADEIPGEVDDVRAEVADRTGPRLGAVEAPDAFVGLPAPALQVRGAEVDDVADPARLDDLARPAHRRDEAVVEGAHVLDARPLDLDPLAMR